MRRRWDTEKVNEALGEFTEGSYITTGKFVRNLFKDFRTSRFAVLQENWKDMTRMERANIHRTLTEVVFLISAIIMGGVFNAFRGEGDDDEENGFLGFGERPEGEQWMWSFMAYQAVRLKTELLFFVQPMEAMRILRSPAATMSVFENTYKLMQQVFTPFDRYEQGSWKGKPKISKTLNNFVPGLRQIYRLKYVEDQISWFRY